MKGGPFPGGFVCLVLCEGVCIPQTSFLGFLTALCVHFRLCVLGLETEAMPQAQSPLTQVGCEGGQGPPAQRSQHTLCLLGLPSHQGHHWLGVLLSGLDWGGDNSLGDFHPPKPG